MRYLLPLLFIIALFGCEQRMIIDPVRQVAVEIQESGEGDCRFDGFDAICFIPQPVEVIVEVEKIVEVPVEVIKEVIRVVQQVVEVPVEVVKIVEKPFEVIKEVEKIVEVPVEVVKIVEKIVKVPVETIKIVEVVKEVPVETIKEVEKIVKVGFTGKIRMSDAFYGGCAGTCHAVIKNGVLQWTQYTDEFGTVYKDND